MSLSLRLFGETTHKVFLSSSSSSVSTRTRSPPFSSLLSSSSSTAFFSHHRHLLSKEVETRRSNISFSSCTFHSLSSSTSFDVSLFIEDRKMRRMFSSSQGKWSDSVRQKMDELKQKSKKSRDSLDAIKREIDSMKSKTKEEEEEEIKQVLDDIKQEATISDEEEFRKKSCDQMDKERKAEAMQKALDQELSRWKEYPEFMSDFFEAHLPDYAVEVLTDQSLGALTTRKSIDDEVNHLQSLMESDYEIWYKKRHPEEKEEEGEEKEEEKEEEKVELKVLGNEEEKEDN